LEKDLPNHEEVIVQPEKPNNNSEIDTTRERLLTSKKLSKLQKRSGESEGLLSGHIKKTKKGKNSIIDSIWSEEVSLSKTVPKSSRRDLTPTNLSERGC
jgi:hypothetical protein